ncbi:hypothetical protein LIER_40848 [Lithospermum erythrorhizon]|uniref:Uncharacterized protein n=1 Tax=Lithospermum erythrorhizon TaxID=34254 RepID=A0AAV3R211_LITER
MTQKAKQKQASSLCEKSMEIVLNLIKVSSFSLATMNLGPNSAVHGKNKVVSKTPLISNPNEFDGGGGRRRLKGPETSKSATYLLKQDEGDKSSYKVLESSKNIDDGYCSDYIKKVHKRNGKENTNAPTTKIQENAEITNRKVEKFIRRFHERNRSILMSASTGVPYTIVQPPPNYKQRSN